MARDRQYTVKFYELGGKKKRLEIKFKKLLDARQFGLGKFRLGLFKELCNERGTKLPLK